MGIQYDAPKAQSETSVWIQSPTKAVRESTGLKAQRYQVNVDVRNCIWDTFISLWIAGVFLAFVMIRVLGSNTAASIFHAVAGH